MSHDDSLNELEIVKLQVEAWKTAVSVQQHFNDIGMRIRVLFLTLIAALLGTAAGFSGHAEISARAAIQAGNAILGAGSATANYILLLSLVIIVLFWWMDAGWYHQFLIGAVKAGSDLEKVLAPKVNQFLLTTRITEESHRARLGVRLTTARRLSIFYGTLAFVDVVAYINLNYQVHCLHIVEVFVGIIFLLIAIALPDKRLTDQSASDSTKSPYERDAGHN